MRPLRIIKSRPKLLQVMSKMMKQKLFLSLVTLALLAACNTTEQPRKPADNGDSSYVPARRIIDDSFKPKNPAKIRVAFFDADSTLRVSKSGSVSANGPEDVVLLPCIGRKLKKIAAEGYLIGIVSNQGGVRSADNPNGPITLETADRALQYTMKLVRDDGGEVHWYDFAEKKDERRKPGIGMASDLLEDLKKKFGASAEIDKAHSYMVGDSAWKKAEGTPGAADFKPADKKPDGSEGTHFSNSDRLFAKNYFGDNYLKHQFFEPTDFFGWRKNGIDVFSKKEEVKEYLPDLGEKACPL
jgi:DNA 3'-phosphatase